MANLLSLKRRIKTAQNVSKTTKAMQMIAASKLKKAQDAALSARPYVDKLTGISNSISSKVDPSKLNDYMKSLTDTNHKLLIVIGPDKGLCGGLVTNLAREVLNFAKDNKNTTYITIGKKSSGIVSLIGEQSTAHFDFGTTLPSYEAVFPVMNIINDHFLNKKVSEVYIANSNFISVFSQKPTTKKLLPAVFEKDETVKETESIFEPSADEILPSLIKHYLEMSVYQAFLESYLSEQSARMLAMQNATDNAKDIIEELKLLYNKTRQEKITNEILDISGGAFINA
jgi:F-type H+-transporting ATPase subunit gamma